MAAIDDLANDITNMETAIAAVITYLDGLPALIADAIAQANAGNGTVDGNIQALAARVEADTQKLKDAYAGAPVDSGPVVAAPPVAEPEPIPPAELEAPAAPE